MVPDSPMPLAPSALAKVGVSIGHQLERRELGGRDRWRSRRSWWSGACRRRRRRSPPCSAWATPWAMPPCTWPSASSGLRMRAGVVDGDEAPETGLPRLGVDLDDGHVGAERERGHGRREVGLGRQRRHRRPPPASAQPTDRPACRRRGSGRVSVVEHDVGGRRLEQVGGPLAGGVDQLGGGAGDGGAADLDRAGADGEAARRAPRRCRRGRPRCPRWARRCGRPRSSPTSCRGPGRTAWRRCAPAAALRRAARRRRTRCPARRR